MNSFAQARRLSALLLEHGVLHWLEYGSLLGAVRKGRANPSDDIDFGCFWEDRETILRIAQPARRLGLLLREQPCGTLRFQPARAASHRIRCIDLYPSRKEGSTLVPVPVPGTRFKYMHVDELEWITFEGFRFPCPRNREKLLALRYGDTWEMPIREGRERVNESGAATGADYLNEGREEGPITGYADGVFDLFHVGHVELLRRGKKLFDRFVVGVHSDTTARGYKRRPILSYLDRLTVVRACKYVDDIIEDAPLATTLGFLRHHGIDYVLHGRAPVKWLEQFYAEPRAAGKLHLIARTPRIDTTSIIQRIARQVENRRELG